MTKVAEKKVQVPVQMKEVASTSIFNSEELARVAAKVRASGFVPVPVVCV